MSNQVNRIDIIYQLGFRLSVEKWEKLVALFENNGQDPESSLLEERWRKDKCLENDGYLYPYCIWWSGAGSMTGIEWLWTCLKEFEGEFDLVVYHGYGVLGVRVRDGEVTQHKVVVTLGDPC